MGGGCLLEVVDCNINGISLWSTLLNLKTDTFGTSTNCSS